MAAIQTALSFIKKSKPISPTSTGGVFIHLSPLKKMHENFQENLLDKCNQRLLCCDQRIEELTRELKEWKARKVEALKLQKAIKEAK